jgi:hypothetical protein
MKKRPTRNSIFTLIVDYDGGTYISQWSATSPKRALVKWARSFDFSVIPRVKNSWLEDLRTHIARERPVRISGTKAVWCESGALGNKLMIINIVRTATSHA